MVELLVCILKWYLAETNLWHLRKRHNDDAVRQLVPYVSAMLGRRYDKKAPTECSFNKTVFSAVYHNIAKLDKNTEMFMLIY